MNDTEHESTDRSLSAVFESAPGRVNLIGEHTDYNGGYVLPMALPLETRVGLNHFTSTVGRVRAVSSAVAGSRVEYQLGQETRTGDWSDYLKGVTKLLLDAGHRLGDVDIHLSSDVPLGSGLSSSASLEIALLKAFRHAFALSLTDLELAVIGQRVENEFVGARVGIMDQMAAALARPGSALFIDTRTLRYESIPLPLDRVEILVINSGVSHRLAYVGNDAPPASYNTRRAECEEAARGLGVDCLSDLKSLGGTAFCNLPETLQRRVRHVVTENARVLAAVECLQSGDVARLGVLFNESHASMRDDYEVSIPEIDTLVDCARAERGVFGARLTGGGFGGSIVALAEPGLGRAAALAAARIYSDRTGHTPTVLLPKID